MAKDGGKVSKKRSTAADSKGPNKTPRRSKCTSAKPQLSTQQMLAYILSDEAEETCRPDDESEEIRNRKQMRTYSHSVLNPFEELLCAVILARPISHRLGLRTIRTILNDPYHFTSAQAIVDAGDEKVHEAVWTARTQHKQKTAEEISHVARVVLDKFTAADDSIGTELQNLLVNDERTVEQTLEFLKENVKGLGATALGIFRRRVQWLWKETYPYVDDRTSQALAKLSLPENAEELKDALDESWTDLDTANFAGGDEASRKRRAFVVVLERAIGADLEGKVDTLLDHAAAS